MYSLKLTVVRLAFVVLSVFFLIAFTWLLKLKYGFVCYSAVTAVLCFSWIFGEAYAAAERDVRAQVKVYPLRGAVLTLVGEIPTVLLLLWLLVSHDRSVPNLVYTLWNAPLAGFLIPNGNIFDADSVTLVYFFTPLFFPISSGIGYYAGLRHFSGMEKYLHKLIYKDKQDEKNN